jgi:hypothetical protein
LIQLGEQFRWGWHFLTSVCGATFAFFAVRGIGLIEFFIEYVAADIDAFVTNIDPRAGDEFFNLGVALSAEGAHGKIGSAGHRFI